MLLRARKPPARSAPPRETASEGRSRALRGCSLTFSLALLSDTDRVAAVVLDVIERATAVRCVPACADSLYSGEERTRGEPRYTGARRTKAEALLLPPYRTTP